GEAGQGQKRLAACLASAAVDLDDVVRGNNPAPGVAEVNFKTQHTRPFSMDKKVPVGPWRGVTCGQHGGNKIGAECKSVDIPIDIAQPAMVERVRRLALRRIGSPVFVSQPHSYRLGYE